jgi:hypothetical protein
MLKGLPDRPLSHRELEILAQSNAIGFVLPATPNSLRNNEEGKPRIHDLLISTGATVTAVGYKETDGWVIVNKSDADRPKEKMVGDIIEYQDYDIEDEEKVREFVTDLYGAIDEV